MVITSHNNIYHSKKTTQDLIPRKLQKIVDSVVLDNGYYTLFLKEGFDLGPKYNYKNFIVSDDLEFIFQEVLDNFG